jgi:hypothetical protein
VQAIIVLLYRNSKSDVFTKLVPQGNTTVVHGSTNVLFHVCPEMYPFLPSGITIYNIRVRQWNIIQLLPALKVNNYEVHRKCRQ